MRDRYNTVLKSVITIMIPMVGWLVGRENVRAWFVGLVWFGFIDILRESRALIRGPKCGRNNTAR